MNHPLGWLSNAVVVIVRIYQRLISPLLGPRCRFTPTCSEYLILALRKYGLIHGLWKGIVRICKCHPWHPGGQNLP